MANDRLAVFDLIKSKTRELGEEGFIQWWHGLDDSGFRVIQNALRDPGFKLRPEQRLPEGHWRTCFWRTGRGWGKTFAASSAANDLASDWYAGGNGILVGATVKDVRDTMIEGDSGIIATARPNNIPHYNKHDNILEWPNGSKAIIRTADNPEDIRGPTLNWGWADELVKWRDERSWMNLNLCVRNQHAHGARILVTTTPKRAKQWIKDIETTHGCIVVTGSTMDNRRNLDATYIEGIQKDLTGIKGREEVLGEWVGSVGNLWTDENVRVWTKKATASLLSFAQSFDRLVLSVDPSGGKQRDETGIVLLGYKDGHVYVLADWSSSGNIREYTDEIVKLAQLYLRPGDYVLLETNNNVAVKEVLNMKAPSLQVVELFQSSKMKKYERAELAFSHFAAEKVTLYGEMPKLTLQMKEWTADDKDSPDRADAMASGVIHLLRGGGSAGSTVFSLDGMKF